MGETMSAKKTPEENGSEEKIDVIDVGNKESAKIIENWSEAK